MDQQLEQITEINARRSYSEHSPEQVHTRSVRQRLGDNELGITEMNLNLVNLTQRIQEM